MLAALAAVIPIAAIGWLLMSGMSPVAAPVATAAPRVVDDTAIVNINGVIPQGRIAGTGMVLTSGGIVLTNNHVVANTTSLTAQLAGRGPIYPAVVIGVDPTQDVALIQLQGASGLPTTPFDLSGSLAVGDAGHRQGKCARAQRRAGGRDRNRDLTRRDDPGAG